MKRTPVPIAFLLAFWVAMPGTAQSSPRACDRTVRPVPARSDLEVAIDRAFLEKAHIRGRKIHAESRPARANIVRNCTRLPGNRWEISVAYSARGVLNGARSARVYHCGSTFRKQQYYSNGKWSTWQHVKTGCSKNQLPSSEYIPSEPGSIDHGDSSDTGGSASPDEIYDPDYDSGRGGGPDEVDDGEGSRSGGDEDFGDLYH